MTYKLKKIKEQPAEYYDSDTTYYVYQYELYDDETGAVTRRNATPHEICEYRQVYKIFK